MRRLSAIVAVGVTLLAGPASADAPSGDLLRMLDQFMVARSAATQCGGADAATMAAFHGNYRQIALRARGELKSLLPDLGETLIEKLIHDHYDDIDRQVSLMVAQESCKGPRVHEALQKYDTASQAVTARLSENKIDQPK